MHNNIFLTALFWFNQILTQLIVKVYLAKEMSQCQEVKWHRALMNYQENEISDGPLLKEKTGT